MRDFRNLDAWHKAHAFTLQVFEASGTFPKSEEYGLAATLRRGTTIFTMKIAEACGQDSHADFTQGLSRARAIGMEVEYTLLLAKDLEFLRPNMYEVLRSQLIEIRRMLSGLIKSSPAQG